MNLWTKQKQTHRQRKQTYYGDQRGERGRRAKLGVWNQQILTTTCKIDKQQGFTV